MCFLVHSFSSRSLMARWPTFRGRGRAVTPSCYAHFRVGAAAPERVPHCRRCAKVLFRKHLESLLSGAHPDPSKPARDPDAVSRLKLTQALQRAKYAIAWERSWPHLARLLTIVGLFLVTSWAGLWLALPFIARAIGLGLFVVLALGALFPLLRFRWPSREEGLSRLDRGPRIPHRPATAVPGTPRTPAPGAP